MAEIEVVRRETKEIKYLQVDADVRYWEDATVNGIVDTEGTLIPCRVGDAWSPTIDIDSGIIEGWPEGTIASVHYKVCDAGHYELLNADRAKIVAIDGYVPGIMSPGGSGYGDYIIMTIGPDGAILNWDSDDLDEFERAAA